MTKEDKDNFWRKYSEGEYKRGCRETIDKILKAIRSSKKNFGIIDKKGRGGALQIYDIEEIINLTCVAT